MPRGVYERKSAPSAGALKKSAPKVKAKPAAKKAKKRKSRAGVKAAPVATPKRPELQLVKPEFLVQPEFYRNKRVAVDDLAGQPLQAYARSIGITQRDVDGLTEDRLRQNCKARISMMMEEG